MKRKVLCFNGKGNIFLEKEKVLELKEYQVLVKVKASLISPGTEIGSIKNLRETPQSYDKRPFGYGNSGIVIDYGKDCKDFKEGMRVACMGAGYALHTDFAVIPQNLCIPIPDNVSFKEASFAHLAATSLNAVRRAKLQFGENILVFGLGIIGNIIGQIANLCGCHTIGVDLYNLRREIGKKVGFKRVIDPKEENLEKICNEFTSGYGIDCSFICFGGEGTEIFNEILKVTKTAPDTHKMGRIVIPGGCQINIRFPVDNLDILSSARTGPGYHDPEYEKGKDYPEVFVQWTTKKNLQEIIRSISENKLLIKPLITHTFSLEESPEACELLIKEPQKSLGVILKP